MFKISAIIDYNFNPSTALAPSNLVNDHRATISGPKVHKSSSNQVELIIELKKKTNQCLTSRKAQSTIIYCLKKQIQEKCSSFNC